MNGPGPVPAPLPFPAPQGSPSDAPEVGAAWLDLLERMVALHGALDHLERGVDAMLSEGASPAALRAAADHAFRLSEVADGMGRAIHDAFPDQLAPRPE